MSATVKIFHVGGKCFKHVMSSYHDLVELRDEDDETLLTYSDNSKVFDQNGRLGNIDIEYIDGQPRWVYYEMRQEIRMVLSPDLPTAEVEVSRRYITRACSAVADQAAPAFQARE